MQTANSSRPGSTRRLLLAFLFLTACSAPSIAGAEDHVVEIANMAFSPAEIDVKVGDTVTFVNHDLVPHTATASGGEWDSGSIGAGDEWSVTIDKPGETDYVCTFHPAMTGVVRSD